MRMDDIVNDTISRQAAIKGKISIQRANGVEIYSDEAVPVDYLKRLPPAQPVWIMASEKLPEKEGLYLVAGDFPPGAEVHTRYFNVLHDRSVWSGTMTDKVKWWMPIPKPPEGAQDE